jgi:hypothetical protein
MDTNIRTLYGHQYTYFIWAPIYILDIISLNSSQNENISEQVVEKIKNTHFIFSK